MDADVPTVSAKAESDALGTLFSPVDKRRFQGAIRRLQAQFTIYATTCPVPLPAARLVITPEIRSQCELFLPIADITAIFNRLYSAALTYPPILSSTPFHHAMSWADAFADLLPQFQLSANPARLLEALLADGSLLTRFLFASFLPDRFYGGIGRYPLQRQFVREWLLARKTGTLRCLDAACGTGEDAYGLALLLSGEGYLPEQIQVEGWTVEPLEVWAATQRRFPHDLRREEQLRGATSLLFEQGFETRIHFSCVDLIQIPVKPPFLEGEVPRIGLFDLILCNGLLGGPIIHGKGDVDRMVGNLVRLLSPGGILLAADNFHGGWKQKCPQSELRALFEAYGLQYVDSGEGVGGVKQ